MLLPQVATNKRYAGNVQWTVAEVAERAAKDSGKFDILVSPPAARPAGRPAGRAPQRWGGEGAAGTSPHQPT